MSIPTQKKVKFSLIVLVIASIFSILLLIGSIISSKSQFESLFLLKGQFTAEIESDEYGDSNIFRLKNQLEEKVNSAAEDIKKIRGISERIIGINLLDDIRGRLHETDPRNTAGRSTAGSKTVFESKIDLRRSSYEIRHQITLLESFIYRLLVEKRLDNFENLKKNYISQAMRKTQSEVKQLHSIARDLASARADFSPLVALSDELAAQLNRIEKALVTNPKNLFNSYLELVKKEKNLLSEVENLHNSKDITVVVTILILLAMIGMLSYWGRLHARQD
uniref:Uncharacterized protein n=1 Tax=Candidatus Kentrum sp. TUN TaxID=2126343 RepID=A0A450ZI95_9GAMM|nr:MAG: hypothetical protein BECKTUN1418F_GA0071002_10232 [Candidatus Kentron sp. TUN]VFK55658.1 MAG: hypothetical protein BECKTUN1418E_GA0071001_103120 [Candidatus Kentron sp. TUN]